MLFMAILDVLKGNLTAHTLLRETNNPEHIK